MILPSSLSTLFFPLVKYNLAFLRAVVEVGLSVRAWHIFLFTPVTNFHFNLITNSCIFLLWYCIDFFISTSRFFLIKYSLEHFTEQNLVLLPDRFDLHTTHLFGFFIFLSIYLVLFSFFLRSASTSFLCSLQYFVSLWWSFSFSLSVQPSHLHGQSIIMLPPHDICTGTSYPYTSYAHA